MNSRAFLILFLLTFTPILMFCQESIPATGGEATGTGTVSYSIGQIFYKKSDNGKYSSSLGVQQPYEIYELDIPGFEDIILDLLVYPNPTIDVIHLKTPHYSKFELSYLLHDINGKQINSNKISQKITEINLKELSSAVYFLNISEINEGLVKSFRIIKN
ncbi:MAG: hypothetical protein BM563_05075 [Bacteroidetes bacterium MedPE-SWsnd-G1]|nr:MAG: hypothetical protein BM563_05075 [Bacteroidetes bacterium MedPE-SWsnd-G1]